MSMPGGWSDGHPPGPANRPQAHSGHRMNPGRLTDALVALRKRLGRFGRAQTATEYALILAAVAVVVVGAYVRLDRILGDIVFRLADRIGDVMGD